jgi:uncharacterized protein (TIGR00369 family)
MTPADAQQMLADNFAPWVLALKPTVRAVETGGATLAMPLGDHIARIGGIASGQALAALADTSMVIACAAHMGEWVPVATTNLDTQFLAAAKGEAVRSEAEIVKAGRALIFARATLYDEPSGRKVAAATATFFKP